MSGGSAFGGETRAVDGCIVTYELPNGTIHVERFRQVLHTKLKGKAGRHTVRSGATYLQQAATRADELDAMILSISTPTTILTDMTGHRSSRNTDQPCPEPFMLGTVGRSELFKAPTGQQASHNIRQVRQYRGRS